MSSAGKGLVFGLESLESRSLFAAVPAGFTDTEVVSGFYNPTAMAATPDGRVLVTEQPGRLRVVKNNQLLTTPAISLSVSFTGERGLLGVAVDPSFATNNYIYLYYTTSTGTIHNRVSRFTLAGDTINPTSEVAIIDLDPLATEFHNAGAMNFGVDQKLYISTGENGSPAQAQSLTNTHGKILRINKDGTIPTDNPFYSQTTGNNRAIFAYGLRNPFTFAIQPGTGRIFANDVGQERIEEVDDIVAGGNYGWPEQEGPGTNPAYINPVTSYDRTLGSCIAGGAFYNPTQTNFPTPYLGQYFYGDYVGGWIRVLDPATRVTSTFATNIPNMIGMMLGPDGSLMYLNRGFEYSNTGVLGKITYDQQASRPPSITRQPASLTARPGEQAIFSVISDGSLPLSYQWYRNGTAVTGATGTSYTLSNAQLADNGTQITVRVTNTFGNVLSNAAILTVQNTAVTQPTITQEPTDQTAAIGETATFSIIASGGNLTYQWYRNGQAVSGATGANWSKVVTGGDNSMAVQCYVTNSVGTVQSRWVKLNLSGTPTLSPPTIVTQPANTSAVAGDNAFFSVQATSSATMTYQWYRNNVAIAGAVASTLVYPTQSSDNGAQFKVMVTNSAGSTTSANAQLSIVSSSAPTITQHPASQIADVGATATFSVTATGSNLSYQWRRDGNPISGATSSTYSFVAQASDNTARFTVTVTNTGGGVTSNAGILTVLTSAQAAPAITQQPTDQSAAVGNQAIFRIVATGGGLNYQWYRNGQPVTGATGSAWTFSASEADRDMAVQCRVSNTIGTTWSNWTKLNLVSSGTAPVISQGPASQAVSPGTTVNFSVVATGASLTYQWYRNGLAISGATSSMYSLVASAADNEAQFLVAVSNSAGSVMSQAATLTVTTSTSNAPVATILTPTDTLRWAGGDVINFSGSATDAEDGVLPASGFSWVVIFHHDTHTHPFIPPIDGVKSGSFTAPNNGHTETGIWYRIRLTVTDSSGQTSVVTRDVYPRLVSLTLETNIPGLSLKLDAQPLTANQSVQSVVGVIRTLEAPASQTLNGQTYDFVGWSDGQTWANRTIWTPYQNTTFRAIYQLRT